VYAPAEPSATDQDVRESAHNANEHGDRGEAARIAARHTITEEPPSRAGEQDEQRGGAEEQHDWSTFQCVRRAGS